MRIFCCRQSVLAEVKKLENYTRVTIGKRIPEPAGGRGFYPVEDRQNKSYFQPISYVLEGDQKAYSDRFKGRQFYCRKCKKIICVTWDELLKAASDGQDLHHKDLMPPEERGALNKRNPSEFLR